MIELVYCECGETQITPDGVCVKCGKFRGKNLCDILKDLEEIKDNINKYLKHFHPNETETKQKSLWNCFPPAKTTTASETNIKEYECINFNPQGMITDGFGSWWSKICPKCGQDAMAVVRPGICRCANCDE